MTDSVKSDRPIVVVEDDPGMRKALERLLRAAGFLAVLFPSAEALLDTDAAGFASCIVLDIQLSGLSGFDLRRRLTALGDPPPVIFITAHDEQSPRDEADGLGCVAYFRKPVEAAALLKAIRQAIRVGS